MEQLRTLLKQSSAAYRQLGTRYAEVAGALAQGDYGSVIGGLAELQDLEAVVRATDRELSPLVPTNPASDIELLLAERQSLLREAAEQNRLLSDRSRTMLRLLADDRARIQGGQVAMSGYRAGGSQRGSLVSSAC